MTLRLDPTQNEFDEIVYEIRSLLNIRNDGSPLIVRSLKLPYESKHLLVYWSHIRIIVFITLEGAYLDG